MLIGAIDVGGPAVTLEVGDDDHVARGERRQERSEHLTRPEPAMEQDERRAGAVDLVVDVQAVELDVLPGARLALRFGGHGVLLAWSLASIHTLRRRSHNELIGHPPIRRRPVEQPESFATIGVDPQGDRRTHLWTGPSKS